MAFGTIAAIVLIVLVVAGIMSFWMHVRRRDHPEQTASHEGRHTVDDAGVNRIAPYPGTDRPAGPDAEGMAVWGPGEISSGPEPPNVAGRRGAPGTSDGGVDVPG